MRVKSWQQIFDYKLKVQDDFELFLTVQNQCSEYYREYKHRLFSKRLSNLVNMLSNILTIY